MIKRHRYFIGGLLLLAFLPLLAAAATTTDKTKPSALTITLQSPLPGQTNPMTVDENLLPNYIKAFYTYFLSVVGVLAVFMLIFGGFRWITAAGNTGKIQAAKETIQSALIGLVLAFTSFLLLNTINPALTTLRIPGVEEIKSQLQGTRGSYCFQGSAKAREAEAANPAAGCGTEISYTDFNGAENTCLATKCIDASRICAYVNRVSTSLQTQVSPYACLTPEEYCEEKTDKNNCQSADEVIALYSSTAGNACRHVIGQEFGSTSLGLDKCVYQPILHCQNLKETKIECNYGASSNPSGKTKCWENGGPARVSDFLQQGAFKYCTADDRAAEGADTICCLQDKVKTDIACAPANNNTLSPKEEWVRVDCAQYENTPLLQMTTYNDQSTLNCRTNAGWACFAQIRLAENNP